MSHLLQALILSEPDIARKRQIRKQLTEVLNLTSELVDGNVDKATDEYREATDAIASANAEIIATLAELEKAAETIDRIARAVELLGKLAAMAA